MPLRPFVHATCSDNQLGCQAALDVTAAKHKLSLHTHNGCLRYKDKVFTLHALTIWRNKVQEYKPYFLVFIPTPTILTPYVVMAIIALT